MSSSGLLEPDDDKSVCRRQQLRRLEKILNIDQDLTGFFRVLSN